MIARGRLAGLCRLALIVAAAAALYACGGGGGGGSSTMDLHLSSSSVAFAAFATDPASETKTVQITWSSPAVARIAIGTPLGQTLPGWLQVTAQGTASPGTMVLTRVSNANPPGQYSTTIRVVTGDASARVIEVVDLPVSLEVVAMPTVSPSPVNLSWIESEQPASRQLSVTRDARVQLVDSSLDVNWLDLSSNVPWLTASGGTTGSANNLALTLQSAQLSSMANGVYGATITLTSSTPNISPLQIPASLTLRLPEVHFVAPVAFSDTVATDYVIVRGAGFNDPSAVLLLDGQTVGGPTQVSDTEIRFVPGARIAGSYPVEVTNQLGFARDKADLRVTDPPAYANFSMDAAVGVQERIVSSPINAAVFSQMCSFCQLNGTGTPSTVQRFVFGSGTWTRTQYVYTQLFDIALTPDESSLLVLTATQLLLVDPQTMATTKTVTLPATVSGISRQLAVMNNGLVIIHSLAKAYSLHADNFVTISGISIANGGIQASRDGSRAIFGAPVNDGSVAYRYYDASTGNVVVSATTEFYGRGAYSRHAERAFASDVLVDTNLAKLGTLAITSDAGDISPDGNRVYGLNLSTNPYQLRIFDVSGASPFTELTPISLTGISIGIGRIATDPRGSFVFAITEGKFVVVDVR